MMEELDELPKKSPDLLIYLKSSFETVLNRIKIRGREYELDEELVDYYRLLWQGYDEWVLNNYNYSEVLILDMDNMDIVNNVEDRTEMIRLVEQKLNEIRK